MKRILLSHPHANDVSQATAAALERDGRLGAFFTGVAAAHGGWNERLLATLARRLPVLRNRIVPGVDVARLTPLLGVELAARGLAKASRRAGRSQPSAYDAMYVAHDAAVAAWRWPNGVDGVYAYEDAALWTFQRAARMGIPRVWDLPLPHHAFLAQLWRTEAQRWPNAQEHGPWVEPAWKTRRKDGELALATVVSAASSFTKTSLERMGCTTPIHVLPYGFPVDTMRPRPRAPQGPFTVLSVGTHDLRKGTPYLLEAFKRAGLKDARLRLVGSLRLAKGFMDGYAGMFEHVASVPKCELAAEYGAADVLLFPTLGDGFGLVIQEAMCCGTPVVTTRCGGGPECITDSMDGWIVPERDVDALVETLRRLAADRDHVAAVGRAARVRAEGFTWKEAGARFAAVLGARA